MKFKTMNIAFLVIILAVGIIMLGCGDSKQEANKKLKNDQLSKSIGKKDLGQAKKLPAKAPDKEKFDPKKKLAAKEIRFDAKTAGKIQPATSTGKRPIVKRGENAREFEAKTYDGKMVRLSDYKGKYILIDFWATWCGPCVREMPYMEKLAAKYKDNKDLVILGVSLDKSDKPIPGFLKKYNIEYPQVYDGRGWSNEVAALYGITSIPMTVLIGPDFNIIGTGFRGPKLIESIDAVLNRKDS